MDPNPLQYQTVNESEPLYRAALLSAGAVAFLIVGALGLNFVIHHAPTVKPRISQGSETSPDDSINGVKTNFADNAGKMVGGNDLSGIRNLASGVEGGDSASYNPPIPEPMPIRTEGNSESRRPTLHHDQSMPPLNAGVMRDYGSISPANLGPLLQGG